MISNAKALADLLYSYTFQSDGVSSADVTNASASEKAWIALSITQALQEMHKVAPALFRQRPGITLAAPITGTVTVTTGSDAVTLGTLSVPNAGCTVRIGAGLDNEINAAGDGAYRLRRPHDGATGTLVATLWHDCWIAADGTAYENVLGDVLADGIPIVSARTLGEVEVSRMGSPQCDYTAGAPSATCGRAAGRVLACVLEQWASPWQKVIQSRLRFTPMPGAQTVIDADLQMAAPTISAADLLSTTLQFQTPAGLDESILLPIALKKWSRSPFFRTESSRKGIDEDYLAAIERLRNFRGHQEAAATIQVRGY